MQLPRWMSDTNYNENVYEPFTRTQRSGNSGENAKMKMQKLALHPIHMISAHITSSLLNEARGRCEIGDLLI
jgi:hypothetical protein